MQQNVVEVQLIDESMLRVMQSAMGASSYRRLPVPKRWNPVDRPHVALLEFTDDSVFRFFVSEPMADSSELSVKDLDCVPDETVVEVRYSSSDYRYYRHDGHVWTVVAQARDRFFMEFYVHGSPADSVWFFDVRVSPPD
jgi:hypothetical protein